MTPDCWCDVPTEKERAQEIPVGTEMHQMALVEVVPSVSAEQNAPIRCDRRRRRLIVKNPPGGWLVNRGIDTCVRA